LPDGSVNQNLYYGDSTSHTLQTLQIDPIGLNRLLYSDSGGRLVEVDENVQSWQGHGYGLSEPTYYTNYTYDSLDDLTCAVQSGQYRQFAYDSLRRLVRARYPEISTSGSPASSCTSATPAVTYTYDG